MNRVAAYTHSCTHTQRHTHDHWPLASPVGFGEEDGGVGFADEVLIGSSADSDYVSLPAGHSLQGQGRLHFGPQHAQVGRQHVDEDLQRVRRRGADVLPQEFPFHHLLWVALHSSRFEFAVNKGRWLEIGRVGISLRLQHLLLGITNYSSVSTQVINIAGNPKIKMIRYINV